MKTNRKRITLSTPLQWLIATMGLIFTTGCPPKQPLLFKPINGKTSGFENTKLYPKNSRISFNEALLDSTIPIKAMVFDREIELIVAKRDSQMYYQSWHGHIQGSSESYFTFVKRGDFLAGVLGWGNQSFSIRPCLDGSYGLALVDQTSLPMKADDVTEHPPLPKGDPLPMPCTTTCIPQMSDGKTIIDVMVLYTQKARNKAAVAAGIFFPSLDPTSSRLAIEREIALALEIANSALVDRSLGMQLRLTYVQCTSTEDWESLSARDSKSKLASDPQIDVLRKNYGADLVCLMVDRDSGDECGWADLADQGLSSCLAYSVVVRNCAYNNFSMAHELGHTLGLFHECQVQPNQLLGHGLMYYGHLGAPLQTIMAKDPGFTRHANYAVNPLGSCGSMSTPASCAVNYLGQCSINTDLALTNNKSIVSKYKCIGSVKEVWIRDNFEDIGNMPNTTSSSYGYFNAPEVYVRKEQDSQNKFLYHHEASNMTKSNFLYAIVRNGTSGVQSGYLRVLYGPASFYTPTKSCTTGIKTIQPGETSVIEAICPSAGSEMCSYAVEWLPDPGATSICGSNQISCIATYNRIAAKFYHKIWLQSNPKSSRIQDDPEEGMTGPLTHSKTVETMFLPLENSYLKVNIGTDPTTRKSFTESGGMVSTYFKKERFPLAADTLRLESDERAAVVTDLAETTEIRFSRWLKTGPSENPQKFYMVLNSEKMRTRGSYAIRLDQFVGDSLLGSYTYQIEVRATLGGDDGPVLNEPIPVDSQLQE